MSNQALERKEYLVGITIYEGRNIVGKDSQGTSDPFLKIRCADQIQQSQKKYEQNSAVWNQSLTFNGLHMNQYELETFELIIELYDHNAITQNELIGQYSIGLSTLHRSLGHEFYKTWIGVFNPEEPDKIQGYLLISCFIVGPNERPPIHSADDEVLEDQESEEEDEEEVARRIENIKRAQGIVQVNNPSFIIKNYQLSAVVQKTENLPLLTNESVYPFVSVRVNGCVLTTKSGSKRDAIFNNKLEFPITYPILNDKITVRMWSKNSKFSANTFIANIPEHPCESDNFNLSQLLRQDGRMKARWFNMYGTHPNERNAKTKGRREGSTYLGRVLIQFSLIPNDNPLLQVHHSNNIMEPRQDNYLLNVDLYEWANCDFEHIDKNMWVVVTQGNFKSEPQQAKKMKKSGSNSYNFAIKKVPELQVDFPTDHDQIPDIIINFYCNKGEEHIIKIGYIRLQAVDVMSRNPKPQWIRIKTPTNDITGGKPGSILCNVNFFRYNPLMGIPDRPFKDKSGKQTYRFYYQILNAYELATAIDESKLNTRVEIQIGGAVNKKLVTKTMRGRYPQWEEISCSTDIMLEKELSFESDLKLTVINEIPETKFSKRQDQIIGELSISLDSIMNYCDRPQYFNLINEEEQFVGSILCNFLVKYYPKDMKKKFEKVDEKIEHKELVKKFKAITKEFIDEKINISLSVFGLRNLLFECYEPEIQVYLTNDVTKQDMQVFTLPDLSLQAEDMYEEDIQVLDKLNPNFASKITFPQIDLHKEPLMWPYIQINVVDKGKQGLVGSSKGCENTYTTISLLDYVDTLKDSDILSEEDYIYSKLQLNRNQSHLTFVQQQIQPQQFLIQNDQGHLFLRDESDEDEGNDVFQDNTPGGDVGDKRMSLKQNRQTVNRATNGPGGVRQTFIGNAGDNWMFQKLNEFRKTHFGGGVDADEIDFDFHEQYLNAGDGNDGEAVQNSEDGDEAMPMKKKQVGQGDALQRQLDTGIIIGEIEIHKVDPAKKQSENRERGDLIQYYKSELKGLQRKLDALSEDELQHSKDVIQMHMLKKQEEIEELQGEEMTAAKFWGMLGAGKDEDDDFDYGRDFLKAQGVTFDNMLQLPYEEIRLFLKPDWFKTGKEKEIVQVGGVLRSGILAQSCLKAAISVEQDEQIVDDLMIEIEDINEENEKWQETKDYQSIKSKYDTKEINDWIEKNIEISSKKHELIDKLLQCFAGEIPFNIENEQCLQILQQNQKEMYRVRVYIISAQNLSAMSNVIDLKSYLAGMTALCTANPYCVISTGNGDNSNESHLQKCIDDRDRAFNDELNPQFLRMYELDLKLPEDWKLQVKIMDKSNVSKLTDKLIGQTVIDMENRRYGDLLMQCMEAFEIETQRLNSQIPVLQKEKYLGEKNNKEQRDFFNKSKLCKVTYLKKNKEWLNRMFKKLKEIEQVIVPVEYRELNHPQKSQTQGIVELWTEILTVDDARKIPVSKMKTITQQTYELRIVIWETKEIPLTDGDSVDIFIRCTFDPTGWSSDEVTLETDTHMSSKDGTGQFNWRMKFTIKVPCEFPRLKFQVLDAGVVSDEAIGETTLNLASTMKKMQGEDSISVPRSYVEFTNPCNPDDAKGMMLFSMDILTKEDADQDPVGIGQDEPNKEPHLIRPTAGRGLGDAMASVGFKIPKISFNPFGHLIYPMIAAAVFALIFLLTYMFK